ncbi:MAG: IS110 family transposase [Chlorobi bacterium]|nr:IS110 family transposase [Chlorobiota bacterium]
MQSKIKKISFKKQNIYIGIDVHFKNWVITIMAEDIVYRTFSQNPKAKDLKKYLENNFPEGNYLSVYEAGFCGFSVHRELVKCGIKNIIVNPADIPTTDKDKRQKEDKRDSRKLAKSLKNGELTGIHILSTETEELRSLVRYRKTIVKELGRHKNRIKSMLKFYGKEIPQELDTASKYWSLNFIKWVKQIETNTPEGSLVLRETIDTAEHLRTKQLKINKELRRLSKDSRFSKTIKLLTSVPGIGLIIAFIFLSELETIKRFKNLDKLSSYVGLIPSTNSSGEKERTGNITRRSNKLLRTSLIEAAWIAIRQDPALILKYTELNMSPNEAIVRIAKKVLNRIRYVLKNEQEYVTEIV